MGKGIPDIGPEKKNYPKLGIPHITILVYSIHKGLSPIEVKIASCQLIFTLIDGSQVVKNAEVVVNVVGEGEKFVEKEESLEVVKDFYYKWSEDWLFPTVWWAVDFNDYEKARELLKGYKESLDGSIVKDDEMLQNRVKEVEEGLDRRVKSGVINCW